MSFRPARPSWKSTAHRTVVLAAFARSLCSRNARGRAWRMGRNAAASVDWAASQAPLVSCGGAPAAPCMLCGERPKTRFPSVVSSSGKMQSNLPEWSSATFAFGKSCPSGQWGINQSGKVAPRAKGQHPLRLRQCEPDLVLTGLTRLLQIETDFMNGRAIFLHYYY